MMIARLCGSAFGAPIGGCDPPQPAKSAAALMVSAKRNRKVPNLLPPR
jgi:hypothetical protein